MLDEFRWGKLKRWEIKRKQHYSYSLATHSSEFVKFWMGYVMKTCVCMNFGRGSWRNYCPWPLQVHSLKREMIGYIYNADYDYMSGVSRLIVKKSKTSTTALSQRSASWHTDWQNWTLIFLYVHNTFQLEKIYLPGFYTAIFEGVFLFWKLSATKPFFLPYHTSDYHSLDPIQSPAFVQVQNFRLVVLLFFFKSS